MPVELARLNAFDDVGGMAAIIPLGSLEQHCRLPVGTDCLIASELARLAAARAEEMLGRSPAYALAPPICYGFSPEWSAAPGTVSLSAGTLHSLLLEVAEGLARWGLEPVIILNGHGGNTPVARAAAAEAAARTGARVAVLDYWRPPQLRLGHACGVEESLALQLGIVEKPPGREGCREIRGAGNAFVRGRPVDSPAWMPGGEPRPLEEVVEAIALVLARILESPRDEYYV